MSEIFDFAKETGTDGYLMFSKFAKTKNKNFRVEYQAINGQVTLDYKTTSNSHEYHTFMMKSSD